MSVVLRFSCDLIILNGNMCNRIIREIKNNETNKSTNVNFIIKTIQYRDSFWLHDSTCKRSKVSWQKLWMYWWVLTSTYLHLAIYSNFFVKNSYISELDQVMLLTMMLRANDWSKAPACMRLRIRICSIYIKCYRS